MAAYHVIKTWEVSDAGEYKRTVYSQALALDAFEAGYDIELVPRSRTCYRDRLDDNYDYITCPGCDPANAKVKWELT